MSSEDIANFMAITSAGDADLAKQYIEMAGGNLDTAISLFFENGGNSGSNRNTTADNDEVTTESDADLAARLQNEAYQAPREEDVVRPPDAARHETLTETHVFPGTYGGIGGSFEPLRHVSDMFDNSRPTGIFNQRIEDSNGDYNSNDDSDSESDFSEEESDFEYVEEPMVEIDEDGDLREYTKLVKRPKHFTKEERLARLFRPPFSIMSKLNLDGAKLKARKKKKWILLNIQDNGIFQCQSLNRDLWSSKDVRKFVKKNFVFLQYQYESRSAEPYINFYGLNTKDNLPHIAILDPMTGERLMQWNKVTPKPQEFINELEKFLSEFSLDPTVSNPIVKEKTPEVDPTTLTEDQQMELAIKESLGQSENDPIKLDESHQTDEETETKNRDNGDLFDTIQNIKHDEPANNAGVTTRIQIRTGDGSRFVRRFDLKGDTVRTIFEVVKSEIDGYSDCKFALSDHTRENLIDKLDLSIDEAGLKNSSILLEKTDL